MIDLLIHCEAVVDHPHGCEENVTVELTEGVVATERGIEFVAQVVAWPDGWAVELERGAPRIRCPEHSPEPPPLDPGEIEIDENAGAPVRVRHTPTGLRAEEWGATRRARAKRLAVKKLAYAVARRSKDHVHLSAIRSVLAAHRSTEDSVHVTADQVQAAWAEYERLREFARGRT